MKVTKGIFDNISKTGYQVVILRDTGECDCTKFVEPRDSNFDVIVPKSELMDIADKIEIADPKCKKCLGTGKKLFPILSNKIRVTSSSGGLSGETKNMEIQLLELIKNDFLNFYFPYNYEFLTLKDYIAIPKLDSTNNVVFPVEYKDIYKIINIDLYVDGEFKYYKVSANKKKVI